MQVIADFDFEAYSGAGYVWVEHPKPAWKSLQRGKPGIQGVGAPVYAEHPSTEVLSLAYDLKDGLGARLWIPGAPPPLGLFDYIARGGLLAAWNSGFEYYIWKHVCHERLGWPPLPLDQLRCDMAKGRAFSLPGNLGKAGAALELDILKDKEGASLIKKLCCPKNPSKADPSLRRTPRSHPDEFYGLYCYNITDIKAEAAISEAVPDLLPQELELWLLDQRINTRGVYIDAGALANCLATVSTAQAWYTEELRDITQGAVQTASEIKKLSEWLGSQGLYMASLDADHVEEALGRSDLETHVRRVLEIRASLGAASVKKLFAIERMLSRDGRLRDLFGFCGASRTGRFAGYGPQPQNLPNSGPLKKWGPEEVEECLNVIATRDIRAVESAYGDATGAVAGCLRGLFSAAPGRDLICSDFSAIEAVVLAQLAGEAWRIEVFRTHGKIYEMSASAITGVPFEEMMEHKRTTGDHHPARKTIGKVAELASGYQGWIGAWKNFGAADFMDDDEIKGAVLKWRAASPAIVKFWADIERAFVTAVLNPQNAYELQGLKFGMQNDKLIIQLLSGRRLTYHQPEVVATKDAWGRDKWECSFMGIDTFTKKWGRIETYGGKLTENVTQATARDILAYAMLNIERAGYPIVLHVHDEIVSEVPEGAGSVEEFEKIMAKMPPWASDWPIKAAGGWRGKRYRKD